MMYLLPLTMLEPSELNKIQWKAIQAILNKLGVSKLFHHQVAFGPGWNSPAWYECWPRRSTDSAFHKSWFCRGSRLCNLKWATASICWKILQSLYLILLCADLSWYESFSLDTRSQSSSGWTDHQLWT
jgi:hypothetical protein